MASFLGNIYDYRRPDSLAAKLRNNQLDLFQSLISSLSLPIKVLDVGGRETFWESVSLLSEDSQDIEITF